MRALATLMLAAAIAGCGYKGPLYLPKPKPDAEKPGPLGRPEPLPERPLPPEYVPPPK